MLRPYSAARAPVRVKLFGIVEQLVQRRAYRGRVSERDEEAAVVRQELARVSIRSRNDGLSVPYCVGQCPGGDLLRVQVRGDVDVRRRQELGELGRAHEAIVKDDVRLHAELVARSSRLRR